jgi:hypothetical protein
MASRVPTRFSVVPETTCSLTARIVAARRITSKSWLGGAGGISERTEMRVGTRSACRHWTRTCTNFSTVRTNRPHLSVEQRAIAFSLSSPLICRKAGFGTLPMSCGAGFETLAERPAPRLLSSYIRCYILPDSRRYQRERRCVMRCDERLAVRTEMNACGPVRMCWLYSSSYKVRSYPSRVNWLS